jgi:hypothetical protein
VRNPLGSEPAAFRFLLLSLAVLTAVTAAALVGGAAAAILVLVVAAVAALVHYGRGRRGRVLRTAPPRVGQPHERRIIVLAQVPVPDEFLPTVCDRADRVLVVSSADAPPMRLWASDLDRAWHDARRRVDATVSLLRTVHANADGKVGDSDPLQAIEDALRTFGGDEIVVSTSADERNEAMVAQIRERFVLPVTHLT